VSYRKSCGKSLEVRAQSICESVAFWRLMALTPAHRMNKVINLRSLILGLSPAQQIAAQTVLETVQKIVPRDWSLEALHSFNMWMPLEVKHVVQGVNEMEIENQSQDMIAAEAESLLRAVSLN
jgi:hypothetical protein